MTVASSAMRQRARWEVFRREALRMSVSEGAHLAPQALPSPVAQRLGWTTAGLPAARDRWADGMADPEAYHELLERTNSA